MGMSKYDRLLYILNLLRTRRNLNAARLAEECGVTERSIYRDMIALSEANVPIYYDNGYKFASDNFLPPLNFDFEEYNCLKLALESSPLALTGKYDETLKQIRAKVDANLSAVVQEKKKTAVDTTHIDIATSLDESIAHKFFTDLEHAVSENIAIDIAYDSIRSGLTSRIVEPYFIVFRGRAFYFVAFCRLRKDFRTFRLDRLRLLEMTDERFRRQQGIDPISYFQDSWEVHAGDPIEVSIRFSGAAAKVIRLSSHHANESIEEIDENELLYRVTVRGTEEICRWILGFGTDAVVITPSELVSEMRRIGQHLSELY
ncbi:MAG: YafY family protein [candidate division Zixibacteria bacterium]